MEPISYEWDEAKRVENLEKHSIDFMAAHRIDWSVAIVDPDLRRDYGEARFTAYVPIGPRLHALTFTPRDGAYRIISFRKANRREQAAYVARMAGR